MDSIALSQKDFNTLKNLIYTSCGISLHDGKIELLKSKIAKRMRETHRSYKEYLSYLKTSEDEVIEFIDTVTTNHSFFFRENKSIEHIVKTLQADPMAGRKEFSLWCAACSTGDEPYTVAVQLKEAGLNFSILATDISHSVLQVAMRGIYRADKVQKLPQPLLKRFFQKGTNSYTGFVKVKPGIRQHIRFEKFNLISDPPPQKSFDAILCRNVMIYFDHPTSEKVVQKLYRVLVPGGLFAIGNAESLMNMNHPFKTVKSIPSLYIK